MNIMFQKTNASVYVVSMSNFINKLAGNELSTGRIQGQAVCES